MIKGIGASPGIVIGKVLIVDKKDLKIEKKDIKDIEIEKERLLKAVEKSKKELIKIKEYAMYKVGEEKAKIFEAHLMALEDPQLIDAALDKINEDKVNCEYALQEIRDFLINIFDSMEDMYLKERATDIKDVSDRIIRNILGKEYLQLGDLKEEVILVANDLTPSDTAMMNKDKVIGFLTNIGGRTSHSAIMARSLEIPAVVGLKDITSKLKNGDIVILNGANGNVIINPNTETIKKYDKLKEKIKEKKKALKELIGRETKTLDGHHVQLAGNIGTPNDIAGLLKNDAEGVGLYRTEFLYMNRNDFPSEEEQFQAYKTVLEKMNPKSVVIRTLDIGGDKELPYLKMDKEINPFLGYRAIRICLDRVDIFKTQLRALLRASVYGKLRIMFPMISSVEELLSAKEILEEVKKELDTESIIYSKEIEIGMMIEVPSAAIISDTLAKHVDFFSIGTNDLIQYTCAVDRMNEKIRHLYNEFHPAVLKLIKLVIDNAHKEGKWVAMCGEAAGDEKMIPILLRMGLDEFSMSPISILPARKIITSMNYKE